MYDHPVQRIGFAPGNPGSRKIVLSKNKGVVEQWFPEKGWGFIREVNNGIVNKYFVHHRNVISGSIRLNARVQFNYGIREKGMYAIEVEILSDLEQGIPALASEVRL